VGNLPVSYPR